MPKAFFISLGCPKNLCDTEVLMGKLAASGYEITIREKDADIYVVNTCAFLKAARDESTAEIKRLAKHKKPVYAAGCLPLISDVRAILGLPLHADINIIDSIDLHNNCAPRIKATPPWTAYVKIAEGCNNRCSYCLIPAIRGKLRVRPVADILDEVKNLAKRGVKEIIFIAQDTTAHPKLPELLKKAVRIKNIEWIRIMYAHPAHITDKLLKVMASEKKICKYLDLPVQHVSENVLKRMNRPKPWGKEVLALIKKIRKMVPGVALRTSLIVGFPGETKGDFEELLAFVKEAKFDRLGCFEYSREPGTPAGKMPGQVPAKIKKDRARQIMTAQKAISKELNQKLIGKTIEVLVEKVGKGFLVGRTYKDAPEIDGVVKIRTSKSVSAGSFIKGRVILTKSYDLIADIL